MLEAVGLDGPGRAAPEERTDPSLLGTGKHGAAIVAERHRVGQQPHELTICTSSVVVLYLAAIDVIKVKIMGVWL
jgi:hypothetical protein